MLGLVLPLVCLQATSQRPAMAFPSPSPSRPCLRPASLSPLVASVLPRPPADQPRPARGHPRPSSQQATGAGQHQRRPVSQQAIRPASQRAPDGRDQPAPASRRQHRRRRPKPSCKKPVKNPYCKFFALRKIEVFCDFSGIFITRGGEGGGAGADFFLIGKKLFKTEFYLRIFA